MQRRIRRASINVALMFSLAAPAAAQTPPGTVTEFYLSLPGGINAIEGTQHTDVPGFENDFFFYANERNESAAAIRAYRKSLIKIQDLKNGYLRLESGDWKGWVEVSIFKKVDRSFLVGISQVTCERDCSGGLIFATYRRGHWKNVTQQVLPHSQQPRAYYQLPRVGTSIALICGDKSNQSCVFGGKLAEFQWNKEKFVRPAM